MVIMKKEKNKKKKLLSLLLYVHNIIYSNKISHVLLVN
jgi:hypothetical protein